MKDRAEKLPLRERKKLRARAGILAAADALIARKGYAETTMREIADAAHVSHQTLYNYFPSKADIAYAMLADVDRDGIGTAESFDPAAALLPTLHGVIRRYFGLVTRRERALWREIVVEVIRNASEYAALKTLKLSASYQVLRVLLESAQARGELVADVDADLLAQTLHGLVDFTFLRFVLEPQMSKALARRSLEAKVDLLVRPYLREADSAKRNVRRTVRRKSASVPPASPPRSP